MEFRDKDRWSNEGDDSELAMGRLLNEMFYPDTERHFLDADRFEQLVREAEAAAAEAPNFPEIKAIENIVDLMTSLRERTELLRGKVVKNITVTLCEDYSGYLGAELHHGKDDVDAPNELCACVFSGPEELLEILRGEQSGQWFLQDESMPRE